MIPVLHDCAAGIADVQVRNRGTMGGSVAEDDPSGDWATVLLTQDTELRCLGPKGERTVPLRDFITDAYTTVVDHEELIREVVVKIPPKGSGGAYLAFKRSAPVYPTASATVQLTLVHGACKDAGISFGFVGLTAERATDSHDPLRCRQNR